MSRRRATVQPGDTIDFTSNNLTSRSAARASSCWKRRTASQAFTAGAYSVDRNGLWSTTPIACRSTRRSPVSVADHVQYRCAAGPAAADHARARPARIDHGPLTAAVNLNSSAPVPGHRVFNAANPASYNRSTSTTVYDSLATRTDDMYYARPPATLGPVPVRRWQQCAAAGQAVVPRSCSASTPAGALTTIDGVRPRPAPRPRL